MPMKKPRRGRMIPAFVACFYAGVLAGWLVRDFGKIQLSADRTNSDSETRLPASNERERVSVKPDPTTHDPQVTPEPDAADQGTEIGLTPDPRVGTRTARSAPEHASTIIRADPIAELRRHALRLPVDGAEIDDMEGSFAERRGAGRGHEAVDILAPRDTPVRAIEGGTIAKLFASKQGGTTIYQFDPTERFTYYYAHLERYANGLHEGQRVETGDVIGYVGTTGNAPKNTPHLHFAIFEMTPDKRWWEGRPLDPYLVFKK